MFKIFLFLSLTNPLFASEHFWEKLRHNQELYQLEPKEISEIKRLNSEIKNTDLRDFLWNKILDHDYLDHEAIKDADNYEYVLLAVRDFKNLLDQKRERGEVIEIDLISLTYLTALKSITRFDFSPLMHHRNVWNLKLLAYEILSLLIDPEYAVELVLHLNPKYTKSLVRFIFLYDRRRGMTQFLMRQKSLDLNILEKAITEKPSGFDGETLSEINRNRVHNLKKFKVDSKDYVLNFISTFRVVNGMACSEFRSKDLISFQQFVLAFKYASIGVHQSNYIYFLMVIRAALKGQKIPLEIRKLLFKYYRVAEIHEFMDCFLPENLEKKEGLLKNIDENKYLKKSLLDLEQ